MMSEMRRLRQRSASLLVLASASFGVDVARPGLRRLRIWMIAAMWIAWFNRRLPLRFTQWTGRPALPLSSGAVPL